MKTSILLLFIMTVLIVLSACTTQVKQTTDTMSQEMNNDEIDSTTEASPEWNKIAGGTTHYLEFNQESFDASIQEGKDVLLYFYANWCPTCRKEEEDLREAVDLVENENLVVYRVNYRDSETDDFEVALAQEHGITVQHTKVMIVGGERTLKDLTTWNKDKYVEVMSGV